MSGPRGASFQPHPGATDSIGPLSWRALAAGQDGFAECGGLPLDFAGRGVKFRPRQAFELGKGLEFGSRQPSACGAGHSCGASPLDASRSQWLAARVRKTELSSGQFVARQIFDFASRSAARAS